MKAMIFMLGLFLPVVAFATDLSRIINVKGIKLTGSPGCETATVVLAEGEGNTGVIVVSVNSKEEVPPHSKKSHSCKMQIPTLVPNGEQLKVLSATLASNIALNDGKATLTFVGGSFGPDNHILGVLKAQQVFDGPTAENDSPKFFKKTSSTNPVFIVSGTNNLAFNFEASIRDASANPAQVGIRTFKIDFEVLAK